jgi:hypothetical protein
VDDEEGTSLLHARACESKCVSCLVLSCVVYIKRKMEPSPAFPVTLSAMSDAALHDYILELPPSVDYYNATGDTLFAKLYRTEEEARTSANISASTWELTDEQLRAMYMKIEPGRRYSIQLGDSPVAYAKLYRTEADAVAAGTEADAVAAGTAHPGYIATIVSLSVVLLAVLFMLGYYVTKVRRLEALRLPMS